MLLSADETTLLERAAEFARQVVAVQASVWERERRIGREAVLEAARLGLTGLEVPPAWGGLGMSFSCKARLADILGAADFAFTMSLLNTHNVAAKLAREAPPEVARRYVPGLLDGSLIGCTALTEPGAGSDFSAIGTRATRTADGWRIDGAKAWITNAAVAGLSVAYAQTDKAQGCLLYTSPSPRDKRQSRMPSSA